MPLLVISGFHLATFPWIPFLPSLFPIVESWTLNLAVAREPSSSLDVRMGYRVTSWKSCHCTLGEILAGQPLLRSLTAVRSVLYLEIMALTVVSSPRAWGRRLCNPAQTDILLSVSSVLFLHLSSTYVLQRIVICLCALQLQTTCKYLNGKQDLSNKILIQNVTCQTEHLWE